MDITSDDLVKGTSHLEHNDARTNWQELLGKIIQNVGMGADGPIIFDGKPARLVIFYDRGVGINIEGDFNALGNCVTNVKDFFSRATPALEKPADRASEPKATLAPSGLSRS